MKEANTIITLRIKVPKVRHILILVLAFMVMFLFSCAVQRDFFLTPIHHKARPLLKDCHDYKAPGSVDKRPCKASSPWSSVPHFQMYLRMAPSRRFLYEYNSLFLPSYRIHFPPERWTNSLVIGLDDEVERNHRVGKELQNTWPYPKIFYHPPAQDQAIYLYSDRNRGFLDQFYPEKYIDSRYVGYIDTDTFFSATVTPESLFRHGKPVIVGRVGSPPFPIWSMVTQYVLGLKEAVQCMAYFPVIFEVKHVIEVRNYIARRFQKHFVKVFQSGEIKWPGGTCQFSIICNYIWYFHRDEYFFQLHRSKKGQMEFTNGMASLQYLMEETKDNQDMWLPQPRVAIHSRYIKTPSGAILSRDLRDARVITELNHILKASYCFTLGLEDCPEFCEEFKNETIFHYLYRFEFWDWEWHEQCSQQQQIYLKEARDLLLSYRTLGIPVFGEQRSVIDCPPRHLRKELPHKA